MTSHSVISLSLSRTHSLELLLQPLRFPPSRGFYFPSRRALMTRCGFEAPHSGSIYKIVSCSGTDSLVSEENSHEKAKSSSAA